MQLAGSTSPQLSGKPRIVHVATRHKLGGAERNLVSTVEFELDRGYEVHVVLGGDSDPASMPAQVEVHVLASLVRDVRPSEDWLAWRRLASLLDAVKADIVHTHLSKAGVVGRLAARGRAKAIVHTVHMASFGPGYSPIASTAFRAAERYCARFTTLFISVGEELRQFYLRHGIGDEARHSVVRSPIDIDACYAVRVRTSDDRRAARAALGLCSVPTVLAIGTTERRKRHALIIERLASLLRDGDIQLVIAGEGPEREALEEQARMLGIASVVRLPGYVPDISDLLTAADLLVHASTVEGVPQVVIQALAAGLPVVATDAAGLREISGAAVDIVPRDGRRLAAAVTARLQVATAPVPIDLIAPWRPTSVLEQQTRFHLRLEQILDLPAPATIAGAA